MKILEKTVMPDGTPIQLEDWSDRNTPEYPNLYGLMIGAYPKQKRGCCNPYPYPGREFRISIDQNRYQLYFNDDVGAECLALADVSKIGEYLSEHSWYRERDMWCLGMDVDYPAC